MQQGTAALTVVGAQGDIAASEESRQHDLGLRGLVLLAQFHGVAADAMQLAHEFGRNGEAFDETTLLLAARKLGLKAKVSTLSASRLPMANFPAMAWDTDGRAFLIARIQGDQTLIHDLAERRPRQIPLEQLQQRYAGRLLQVASRASVLGQLARFDFTWFIPAVIKYRKMLLEVFVVSLFIQLFALVTPLFFQVVMDKVLVH
ncbi:MAG TPA: cysteine peptidase family C39 domain-containing protein, partial [Stenotrophomonas sp.]|nr:cysteine peptidase family C39 domain-containing protein [Stenotrophomonas sp.]